MEKNKKKLPYVILLIIGLVPWIINVVKGIIVSIEGHITPLTNAIFPIYGLRAFVQYMFEFIYLYLYIAIPSIILIFFSIIMLIKNRKK